LYGLKHIADAETVTSYDEASELLLRARELRMDKDADIAMMPLKANTLTVIFGEEHTLRRRIENSLFTRAALERLEFDVLDDALDRRLALVESSTQPQKVDLLQLARFCLLPVTARLVGLCPDGSDQWWTDLSEYVRQFATAAAVQWKEGDASEVREQSLAVAQRFSSFSICRADRGKWFSVR
jgi:cytochrome P450